MHEPHPAEPRSLRRLRAFLGRHAAGVRPLPAPRRRLVPPPRHARRDADVAQAIPADHEPDGTAAGVRRAAPAEASRPAVAPQARFFRSLLSSAPASVPAPADTAPTGPRAAVPPAEAALARALERESP